MKTVHSALPGVLFLFLVLLQSCNDHKDEVVIVDSVKLVNNYYKTKEVLSTAKEKLGVAEKQLQEMSLQVAEFQKQGKTASADSLRALLQQRSTAFNEHLKKEDEKMSQAIFEEIDLYIKEYAQKKGYSLIIAAGNSGNVIYSDSSKDITDDLLKELNSKNPSK